jgi:OPA family glycerol-3-phosphate transporter-like MFS transporter
VFGTAVAGAGVGWIADRWDWHGVFITMIACCVLTMFFISLTLSHTAVSEQRAR